jgi:hypothetical protein
MAGFGSPKRAYGYGSPFVEPFTQGQGGYTPQEAPSEILIEKGIERGPRPDASQALSVLNSRMGGGYANSADSRFIEDAYSGARDLQDARGQVDRAFPHMRALDALDQQIQGQAASKLRAQPFAEAGQDLSADRGAQRAFFPAVQDLRQQTRTDALQDSYQRFVRPAELQAGADLDAAAIGGESRIQAAVQGARARNENQNPLRDQVMQGLVKAIEAQLNTGSGRIDPQTLNEVLRYLTTTGDSFE